MVLVASAQALFFNIAEHNVGWAQSVLDGLSWADTFLQKGTLWLAFLGASLATHHDKHIAIDVLPKLVSPRARTVMRIVACFGAGLVAFVLATVFYRACLLADATVPFDYVVLTDHGPRHVCDADGGDRPALLCLLRAGFGAVGIPVSSGGGIAQLIVPLMFIVIGLRLLARGVLTTIGLVRGEELVQGEEEASEEGTVVD